MRKLLEADDGPHAKRLVDRLLVEGIEAYERPEGSAVVWVVDEDDIDRAKKIAARGRDSEDVAKQAQAIRRSHAKEHGDHAQRRIDVNTRWRGVTGLDLGPATLLLIVGSCVVGLAQFFAQTGVDGMWALTIDHWSSTEPLQRVRDGEVWRLVTPMFLHFGLFHLAFNMAWVWRLAPQVETQHGSTFLLGLVVVSEIVGNLGQYAVSGPAFGGMSGVVYALFGFVWMSARYDRRHRYHIDDVSVVLGMVWFVLCATGAFGPIANIGHAGGLVVGLMFGMPAFVRHARAKGTTPDFAEGSWAEVHLSGFRRFRRRWLQPYVPIWFLVVAAGVIATERISKAPQAVTTGIPACDAYLELVAACGFSPRDAQTLLEAAGVFEDRERGEALCQAGLDEGVACGP